MTAAEDMISPEDLGTLRQAYFVLEHPSFAARLSSIIGSPVERVAKLLPVAWSARLHQAARAAVAQALSVAIDSLSKRRPSRDRHGFHRGLALSAGAVGGFFGLPALLIELPITTIIMLRAIAEIARGEGEDLGSPEAQLACLEVFALGGRTTEDDFAEIGYYEVRAALALHVSGAARAIARHGASSETLPASVRLIQAVATRFGATVSDKAAAQLVPVVGAVAGAAINAVFVDHFQRMATGHFAIRRLERTYGVEVVTEAYRACEGASL